uniref:glycine zipper 2TM domain-containing protein n=1 Tax=Halomonas sp. TaxID=1486246 RepID=UPI0026092104|nr:glycine zipper 2TM domain-containing protein [Halomonas sp.]
MNKSIVIGSSLAVFGLGGLAFGAWQTQQVQQLQEAQAQLSEQIAGEVDVQPVVDEDAIAAAKQVVAASMDLQAAQEAQLTGRTREEQDAAAEQVAKADAVEEAREPARASQPEAQAQPVSQPTYSQSPAYADITAVTPVTQNVQTPREVCEQVPVTRQAQSQDPYAILGTAAGAVIGGVIGHQIGGGSGKKIATAAGVIGGGLAGREVQRRVEAGQAGTTMETQCHTVTDSQPQTVGYDVSWNYNGLTQTSRLDYAPKGDLVKMEGGQPQWGEVVYR